MEKGTELLESDLINIKYDYIEYYVGMAKMVVYWHAKALGFKVVAYAGPETGVSDRCSYYIVKNDIKLVITSASHPSSHKIVSFVDLHGNGIKKVAVKVDNVQNFFENALVNGGIPLESPSRLSDEKGYIEQATIKLFDDNEIIIFNNDNYSGDFMPRYTNIEQDWDDEKENSELMSIDHVACALRINEIKLWESYINKIFFSKTIKEFDERNVGGERKIGMLLKVLQSKDKQMNSVLVEPDRDVNSQVQLFVDQHYGSGIQHVAFSSSNIFKTVSILRKNGVRFTKYPKSYYDNLALKYPKLDIDSLRTHGVLCDVIDDSLLLQIFIMPIGDRPTFFYEIIQRVNNYEGFGLDNITALFDAMEIELAVGRS